MELGAVVVIIIVTFFAALVIEWLLSVFREGDD
jgi:hypothetical protein